MCLSHNTFYVITRLTLPLKPGLDSLDIESQNRKILLLNMNACSNSFWHPLKGANKYILKSFYVKEV